MPRILGHIDYECPKQNVIAKIEEDEAKEEDVEQVIESNHVQEDEDKNSLLLKSVLDVKEVVESNHVQEDEEKSSLLSNFDFGNERCFRCDGFGCCRNRK